MPPSPQAQDAAMRFIFFVFLMLFFSNNQNTAPSFSNIPAGPSGVALMSPRDAFHASLDRQRRAVEILNTTRFGDWKYGVTNGSVQAGRGLNLTGFRESDGYVWNLWGNVTHRVKGMRERAGVLGGDGVQKAMYTNVTGQVRGQWVRSAIGLGGERGWGGRQLNLSAVEPQVSWSRGRWNKNITGSGGAMGMVVRERQPDKELIIPSDNGGKQDVIREIEASLTIEDESHGGEGWEIKLHGVHWPTEGELVLTTTSDKFAGIYGLPHLTLTPEHFLSSQELLNQTLFKAFERREKVTWGLPADPYAGNEESIIPRCEFVVYAQVHPVSIGDFYLNPVARIAEDLPAEIQALENELRFPSGAPVVRPPPLEMTVLAFSPDCGFVVESKGPPDYVPADGLHLQGLKQEVYIKHVKHWCLVWGVVLMCQIGLLRWQMKEASTPSTISRVSLYTVGIMAAADFIIVGSLMLLSTSAPIVFPAATLTALAGLISTGLGVRFLADVWRVQEPERREANRIRDTRLAEELAAFRARREVFLARHRELMETQAAIRSAIAAESAVPVITAAGVDMPGSFPPPPQLPPPPPRVFPTPSPFTENLFHATEPQPPVIVPSDQDIDAETAENGTAPPALPTVTPATPAQLAEAARLTRTQDIVTSYGQVLLASLIFSFLTISSTSWPTILRKIYFHTLAILYFSFWIPQIYRNAIRNCRKAFQWRFVLGQTALRLTPWAYFWLKKDNVLGSDRSFIGVGTTITWVWCQILVLAVQAIAGPRFALPKGWLPDAWDYHPLLREDDIEGSNLPLGLIRISTPASPTLERRGTNESLLQTNNKKMDGDTMSVDCAICMQRLDVPVVPSRHYSTETSDSAGIGADGNTGVTGVIGLLARRLYMVTPCRHVFHSHCLEGWMKYRLQCPICRQDLPYQ